MLLNPSTKVKTKVGISTEKKDRMEKGDIVEKQKAVFRKFDEIQSRK
jgi:hypothetical protein